MFEAKILADSMSPDGVRLTTMAVTYPRIIHAEMLRHRMFSRCAASSRAIPVQRFLEQVRNDPYVPRYFDANKSGMQGGARLEGAEALHAKGKWILAAHSAADYAEKLLNLGVHKQWTNRLLEPFQWMTEVITATEWDNFFHLRIHPDAHPEIREIATLMRVAMRASAPDQIPYGSWHLPLVSRGKDVVGSDEWELTEEELILCSIGRVARVSYLKHEDQGSRAKDIERAKSMLASGHMSPLEHAARPMGPVTVRNRKQWELLLSDGTRGFLQNHQDTIPLIGDTYAGSAQGLVTIAKILGWKAFEGNFSGWIQYRKQIDGEADMLAPKETT